MDQDMSHWPVGAYGIVAEIDKDSFPDSDKILDVAWDTCRASDGKYYGVPWSVQSGNVLSP